ncbi:MAG: TAT-variant-translocated molybdopterin oxidoreductase [Chitinophagales bacterium]
MAQKKYWKGLDEKNLTPEFIKEASKEFKEEIPGGSDMDISKASSNRRDFLKVLGFSVTAATVAASCEIPVKKSIPYITKPDHVTPGIPDFYASSFNVGGEYASILVKTREGRPIKIEGNKHSEVTHGGTSAAAQASVLSLYDGFRLKGPVKNGEAYSWEKADAEIVEKLEKIAAGSGKIVLLSNTVLSPSTKKIIEKFQAKYPGTEFVSYDSFSISGLLDANEAVFGKRLIPDYHFDKADLIVGFGADFLGTWISPLEYAYDYAQSRKVDKDNPTMSRHIQVESHLSLTGSNCDKRISVKPSQEGLALLNVYNFVASKLGAEKISGLTALDGKIQAELEKTANELVKAKGKSLVVSGSNDPNVQTVANALNHILGNYGKSLDFDNHNLLKQGNDKAVQQLSRDMNSGKIDALIVLGGANPVFELPEAFKKGYNKVGLKVSLNDSVDETGLECDYVLPDHHYLESWNDAQPKAFNYSLGQPTIAPIYNTRQAQDTLLKWAGENQSYYDFIRQYWKDNLFKGQTQYLSFNSMWDRSLHNGIFDAPVQKNSAGINMPASISVSGAASKVVSASKKAGSGFEIKLYQKTGVPSAVFASNPYLQELPDPVSKITWDNYACISPKFAKDQGLDSEDMIKISANGKDIELPVFVQPGTAYGTIAIAVAYGREVAGKAGKGIGKNAYPFEQELNGNFSHFATGAAIAPLGKTYPLAMTQTFHSIFDGLNERPIVKETTLGEYAKNPMAGNEDRKVVLKHLQTLYGYHDYPGHRWGMAIDLNACFGCGACVVACNTENNVPVVGKEEVKNRREMHWLRIDRYYSGDEENPSVVFQPMMCQHCDNAPCENVCPVSATNHSSEGLNQMAYNRCIGTRYCANNCPYKVRRFNWFDYMSADSFGWKGTFADNDHDPFGMTEDLTRMVLNPDVTVRSRGVMEKCSFCVQRIQSGKLEAKKEGRQLRDEDISTACQAACHVGAITFGDVNNEESEVTQMTNNERAFKVIEEIHTLPSVAYLTKVRNKDKSEA